MPSFMSPRYSGSRPDLQDDRGIPSPSVFCLGYACDEGRQSINPRMRQRQPVSVSAWAENITATGRQVLFLDYRRAVP